MEIGANRRARSNIGFHDVPHDLNGTRILEDNGILVRLADDGIPGRIGLRHKAVNQAVLKALLALGGDHIATGFVECVDLLGRQIASDLPHSSHNLFDKRFALSWLENDEVALALVRDLYEGVACHVLNACGVIFGQYISTFLQVSLRMK